MASVIDQRLIARIVLAAILLVAAAACGRSPTAPEPNPCIRIDTLWSEKGAVLTLTTVYKPPCPKRTP